MRDLPQLSWDVSFSTKSVLANRGLAACCSQLKQYVLAAEESVSDATCIYLKKAVSNSGRLHSSKRQCLLVL